MEIGDNAFSNCYTLKKVISRIMEPFDISDNVFEGIASNAILTVPEGTKSAYQSKKGWKSFQTIEESVMPGNRFEFNGINYIIGEGNNVSVTQRSERYSGDVVIPSHVLYKTINYTVTSIGPDAFGNYCLEMTSITIPPTVTSIEEDAFDTCMSLTSVYITDLEAWCKIKFISSPFDNAQHFFLNGKEIVDLVIPDKITSINTRTFRGCRCLTSVTIHKNVTSIGENAFSNCNSIKDVYCYAESIPTTNKYAFYYTPTESATLHVPDNMVEAYKQVYPWNSFGTIVGLSNTGIKPTKNDNEKSDVLIFDMQGNKLDNVHKGVNIIRQKDGKTKKVVVR